MKVKEMVALLSAFPDQDAEVGVSHRLWQGHVCAIDSVDDKVQSLKVLDTESQEFSDKRTDVCVVNMGEASPFQQE